MTVADGGLPGAVIFDLDGTLIDSVGDVRDAVNAVLETNDRPALDPAAIRTMIGDGARATIEQAFATTGDRLADSELDAAVADYIAYYVRHAAERTKIYPGVLGVLGALSDHGLRLGVCTNKPEITTMAVLKQLDLMRFFQGVACGDTARRRKPDGRHIHETLELMGATDLSAIMVGDSETDMAAARDARIPSVAVTWGYSRGPAENLDADVRIDDFAALPAALRRIVATSPSTA